MPSTPRKEKEQIDPLTNPYENPTRAAAVTVELRKPLKFQSRSFHFILGAKLRMEVWMNGWVADERAGGEGMMGGAVGRGGRLVTRPSSPLFLPLSLPCLPLDPPLSHPLSSLCSPHMPPLSPPLPPPVVPPFPPLAPMLFFVFPVGGVGCK